MGFLPRLARTPRRQPRPEPRRPFTLAAERDQRGIALPSPVVVLTVVALVMAAVAFVVTRDPGPSDREITPVADSSPSSSPSDKADKPEKPKKTKDTPPPVVRGDVFVEVYNNSGITGLAADVGSDATGAGWKVVGTDNWYGTIPATTVYYPDRLEDAAKLLALDLGIDRTAPAVDPMKSDRLTVILTGPIT